MPARRSARKRSSDLKGVTQEGSGARGGGGFGGAEAWVDAGLAEEEEAAAEAEAVEEEEEAAEAWVDAGLADEEEAAAAEEVEAAAEEEEEAAALEAVSASQRALQLNVSTSWKNRRDPIWPNASPVKSAKTGVRGRLANTS